MKKTVLLLLLLLPLYCFGQDNEVETCAPMKKGKVCYTDEVEFEDASKAKIFDTISDWANRTYGRDVFLSNVSSNKNKGTILITSKIELLLNETDKTQLKFKLRITCSENKYVAEVSDILYLYDPYNEKRYKTYTAESVIANEGKSNTVTVIKDPLLFCNATSFFVRNLLGEVFEIARKAGE